MRAIYFTDLKNLINIFKTFPHLFFLVRGLIFVLMSWSRQVGLWTWITFMGLTNIFWSNKKIKWNINHILMTLSDVAWGSETILIG